LPGGSEENWEDIGTVVLPIFELYTRRIQALNTVFRVINSDYRQGYESVIRVRT